MLRPYLLRIAAMPACCARILPGSRRCWHVAPASCLDRDVAGMLRRHLARIAALLACCAAILPGSPRSWHVALASCLDRGVADMSRRHPARIARMPACWAGDLPGTGWNPPGQNNFKEKCKKRDGNVFFAL